MTNSGFEAPDVAASSPAVPAHAIGYITGIFDMFDIGHLHVLQAAKSRCRYLIAGVATDRRALAINGHTPVIPLLERLEILRSVRGVDTAVPQDADTLDAWQSLNFDALFIAEAVGDEAELDRSSAALAELGITVEHLAYLRPVSHARPAPAPGEAGD